MTWKLFNNQFNQGINQNLDEHDVKTPTKEIPRMSSPSKKRSYAKFSPDLFDKRLITDSTYLFNEK